MGGIPDWLEDAYKEPGHPLAHSGRTALARKLDRHTKPADIENFLSQIYSYPLHRDAKRPRKRNPYFIYTLRQQCQMDLVYFDKLGNISLPAYNDDYKYIITAIDSFSKKAWIAKLKRRDAKSTLDGIKHILYRMETEYPFKLPQGIYSDQGGELKNVQLHAYLLSKNIKIYYAYTDVKASIVERFNKTIQELIYKHMTEKEVFRWVDVIDQYVSTYNNRIHRILQISPNLAELPENAARVLDTYEQKYAAAVASKRPPKYKINDIVRIKLKPSKFARGYHWRFTHELYKIIDIHTNLPQAIYKVENLSTANQPRKNYYFEHLQPVNGNVYRIEKVIKKQKQQGKEWLFVKWKNFHSGHNSWIQAKDVVEVFNGGHNVREESNEEEASTIT